MPLARIKTAGTFVVIEGKDGYTAIPSHTPLVRLNYFDGKFLRAEDLQLEQRYQRQLVRLANQAGGAGVVHGCSATLDRGDVLQVSPGLAIDPHGRALLIPEALSIEIFELLAASSRRAASRKPVTGRSKVKTKRFGDCETRAESEPTEVVHGSELYLITLGHAEAYCGEEDVYGKLCEEACITSTDRPYIVEGVVLRAEPVDSLTLKTNLLEATGVVMTSDHLRSLVASAFFADARGRAPSLVSSEGLTTGPWCTGAASSGGQHVPIALLAHDGSSTTFIDPWIARRERMESPPRHYWAGRMAMRPWNVFLAQVLQFQCQLRDVFKKNTSTGVAVDPCEDVRTAARDASKTIGDLMGYFASVSDKFVERATMLVEDGAEPESVEAGLGGLLALQKRLQVVGMPIFGGVSKRILVDGGIVELPSAGYLPVVENTSVTVNKQVRQLLGEAVDLRFCVVRPDYVPHALEEAQHMERISLLEGLSDTNAKPEVDVLVPDGRIITHEHKPEGMGFAGTLTFGAISERVGVTIHDTTFDHLTVPDHVESPEAPPSSGAARANTGTKVEGAGRAELLPSGGAAFYFAGMQQAASTTPLIADRVLVGDRLDAAREANTGSPMVEELSVGVGTSTPPHGAACWLTMNCTKNPFAMKRYARTQAGFRLAFFMPTPVKTVIDLDLSGDFRVEATGRGKNSRVVKGRFRSVHSLRLSPSSGESSQTRHVMFDVTLKLGRGGSMPSIELELKGRRGYPSYQLNCRFWNEPAGTKGDLTARPMEAGGLGVAFDFQEDADVLGAEHKLHGLAVRALHILGGGLEEAEFETSGETFADDAEQDLFPPPPPLKKELEVLPGADWVLFHRRRDKQCTIAKDLPAPPPHEEYLVYHVTQGGRRKLLGRLGHAKVGVVAFRADSPRLVSDHDDLREEWGKAVGESTDATLVGAAIARVGGATSHETDIDRLRLKRVISAVHAITPQVEGLVPVVSDQDPGGLATPGTDGVILLTTKTPDVEGTCVTVCWVKGQADLKVIQTKTNEPGWFEEVNALGVVKEVGNVRFVGDTPELHEEDLESVIATWSDEEYRVPVGCWAVWSVDQDAAAREAQATAIWNRVLGKWDIDAGMTMNAITIYPDHPCDVIMFVVAKPAPVVEASTTDHPVYEFLESESLQEALRQVKKTGGAMSLPPAHTHLGDVTFEEENATPGEGMSGVVAKRGDRSTEKMEAWVVARADPAGDVPEICKKQAEVILEKLGIHAPVKKAIAGSALPAGKPAMTFFGPLRDVPPPAIEKRLARVVVFEQGHGVRNIARGEDEVFRVEFNPDGSLERTSLRDVGAMLAEMGTLMGVLLGPKGAPAAQNRLDVVFEALVAAKLLKEGDAHTLVKLSAAEQSLLKADGPDFRNLILIEKG